MSAAPRPAVEFTGWLLLAAMAGGAPRRRFRRSRIRPTVSRLHNQHGVVVEVRVDLEPPARTLGVPEMSAADRGSEVLLCVLAMLPPWSFARFCVAREVLYLFHTQLT